MATSMTVRNQNPAEASILHSLEGLQQVLNLPQRRASEAGRIWQPLGGQAEERLQSTRQLQLPDPATGRAPSIQDAEQFMPEMGLKNQSEESLLQSCFCSIRGRS